MAHQDLARRSTALLRRYLGKTALLSSLGLPGGSSPELGNVVGTSSAQQCLYMAERMTASRWKGVPLDFINLLPTPSSGNQVLAPPSLLGQ